MILGLQIYCTVRAFRNGWRLRVLLPWVITFATSFVLGALLVVADGDQFDLAAAGFLLDLGLLGVLGYMARHEHVDDGTPTEIPSVGITPSAHPLS